MILESPVTWTNFSSGGHFRPARISCGRAREGVVHRLTAAATNQREREFSPHSQVVLGNALAVSSGLSFDYSVTLMSLNINSIVFGLVLVSEVFLLAIEPVFSQ